MKSCSFHELNEAVGKQTDPGVSEHLPGLQHRLGFSVHRVLDMERVKLPRRGKTAKPTPILLFGELTWDKVWKAAGYGYQGLEKPPKHTNTEIKGKGMEVSDVE